MNTQPERNRQESTLLTGEQMDPETSGASCFWEHIYRYRFAIPWVRGKEVLDIACGDGYGSASLRQAGAASVIGIDVAESVCDHARRRYGIDCMVGDAQRIPLADHSIDVVVSFETIEHLKNPELFLSEAVRILRPGGRLVVSSPNRAIYALTGPPNPYHCSEMTEVEFSNLLSGHFSSVQWFSQTPRHAAWWSPRSLYALEPWWIHLWGGWRFREAMKRIFCPHLCGELSDQYRADPIKAVTKSEQPWASWLNPFKVRHRNKWSCEQPTYFIAVAQI